MIARVWHGWTTASNAAAYEAHFRSDVLAHLGRVAGYRGAELLRREAGEEVEFVAITLFESIDAVRAFAGADYDVAVIAPEARRLLARFDQRAMHYEVLVRPEAVSERQARTCPPRRSRASDTIMLGQ
jgi:heme-degrading monooxygenase HmoA